MLNWKESKLSVNARVVLGNGKAKDVFKNNNIKGFLEKIDNFKDNQKINEAHLVMLCLEIGRIIKLEPNGEMKLFFDTDDLLSKEPKVTITGNEELYSLVENLVKS